MKNHSKVTYPQIQIPHQKQSSIYQPFSKLALNQQSSNVNNRRSAKAIIGDQNQGPQSIKLSISQKNLNLKKDGEQTALTNTTSTIDTMPLLDQNIFNFGST